MISLLKVGNLMVLCFLCIFACQTTKEVDLRTCSNSSKNRPKCLVKSNDKSERCSGFYTEQKQICDVYKKDLKDDKSIRSVTSVESCPSDPLGCCMTKHDGYLEYAFYYPSSNPELDGDASSDTHLQASKDKCTKLMGSWVNP